MNVPNHVQHHMLKYVRDIPQAIIFKGKKFQDFMDRLWIAKFKSIEVDVL